MNEPIRVLQIVTTMNRGGLETMLMNYYRNINRSLIQFDFLEHRNEKSDYDDEIEQLGGRVYRIGTLNPFSIKYRKQIKIFFDMHPEYRIVHCHLDCMSSLPLSYAKKAGIPVRIAHSHSSSQDKNLKYLLKLFYKRKIPKESNYLFACGNKAGSWMYGGQRFTIINNAIDSKLFLYDKKVRDLIRKKMNIEKKFVIGHVGRFNEPKNHLFIIDIFNELVSINKNAHLVLVGEGILKEKVAHKVKTLGLSDRVTFYGKSDCVNQILQAFDIFLFPSLYEGLPVTMIEAQSSGLKCFISDKVPSECIISDNVETLKLEDSAKKWAENINKYSSGYERKDMMRIVCNHGFDIQNNVKKLEGFYINEYKEQS